MLKSEFNSDVIAAESWVEQHGMDPECLIQVETSDKDPQVAINSILSVIESHKEAISIISMSLVSSHFCHYYDVQRLIQPCKLYNIKIVLDFAHSLGSVPINLTEL